MVHATGARGAARSRAACPASPRTRRPALVLENHLPAAAASRRVRAGGGAGDPDVRRPDARPRGGVAAVRHLRHRRNALRGGLQHHPGPVRLLQRAAVPDPARLRQQHPEHRPASRRRDRQLRATGLLLLRHDLYHHRAVRPDLQRQQHAHLAGQLLLGLRELAQRAGRAAPTSARTRWRCP